MNTKQNQQQQKKKRGLPRQKSVSVEQHEHPYHVSINEKTVALQGKVVTTIAENLIEEGVTSFDDIVTAVVSFDKSIPTEFIDKVLTSKSMVYEELIRLKRK